MTDRSSAAHRGQKSIHKFGHKFGLTLAASALTLAFATTVFAQDAAPAPDAATAPVDDTVVVVRGVRASLTKSLSNKRRATQVVESVVAEDIGKLPDNNVVEALQRVTGVQVTNRSGGEVGTISIRGMPDINTTWNGRNIFTASGTQVALQDIPSTLVRQIDVYKTRDASQIPTGIAGQIDVKSLRPFDFKGPEISIAARATYLDPAKEWNPQLSALFSNRWSTGAGDFGALINLSDVKTKYRNESVTPGALVVFAGEAVPGSGAANTCDPSNPYGWVVLERIQPTDCRAPDLTTSDPTDLQQLWEPGLHTGLPQAAGSTISINGVDVPYYLSRDAIFQADTHGERERPAANIALQWQPNADAVYTFEAMYNGYRDKIFNNLLFSFVDGWWDNGANPLDSITTYPGTNVIKTRTVGSVYGFNSGDYTTSATDSYVYALNGKWNIGDRLKLDGDLSYQSSVYHTEFTATRIDRTAPSIAVDFNAGDDTMSFHFNNDADLTDPTKWSVAQFYDNANRNEGSAVTASLNGVYDADWGVVKTVSFGARYDDRKASEANRVASGYLGRSLASFSTDYYFTSTGFATDFADVPRAWLAPNGAYIRDHIDEWRTLYNMQTSGALTLNKTFDVEEKTGEVYVMADSDNQVLGHRLRGNLGLRYVNVQTDMNFYGANPGTVSKTASKVLPSLTLRYDLSDDLLVRLNYGETLRRPNFTDLNPYVQLNDDVSSIGYGSGSGGNPDLEPTESKNLDLTAEWYFSKDSALYGTLFTRNIEGLVVSLRHMQHVSYADDPNRDSQTSDHSNGYDYVVNTPVNASDGKISGAELGLIWFPKNLPGFLDGLGFQGSVTTLTSSQNVPDTNSAGDIVAQLKTPFFGVSRYSYNATLAYDKGPVGARLSYVWRSGFLSSNEASSFANPLGIWRHPEKSLDAQLTWNVNDRLSFDVDAVNITNELQQQYYAFGDAGSASTTDFGTVQIGRSFSVGLRWKY